MKKPGALNSVAVVAVVIVLVLGHGSVFSEEDPPTLEDLTWMAGHWKATVNGVVMEEGWFKPLGGVMLGLHRDVRPDRSAFFEYLRVPERADGLVYVASPMGRGATEFRATEVDGLRVVFSNPGHDFPQKIIYVREGDRLTARAEAVVEGALRSEVWEWQLME